jgi:very-short-patch-repair endonuclease
MRKKELASRAKRLRRDMTDAERKLWHGLKDRRLAHLKFRRQHAIGTYIADFVCLERGLIVEVDGGQHADSAADSRRDATLTAAGFRVLRFWNNEVLQALEGVLDTITAEAANRPLCYPAHGTLDGPSP